MEIAKDTSEHWNRIFQNRMHHNGEPSPPVVDLLKKYGNELKGKSHLDLGGAQGANSLYALKNGMFESINVDFAEIGIEQYRELAKENGFKEHSLGINMDVTELISKDKYPYWHDNFALISALFLFHNFDEATWKGLVVKMQTYTDIGGFNLIVVPKTQVSDQYQLPYVFKDNEIDALYVNPFHGKWEIDDSFSRNFFKEPEFDDSGEQIRGSFLGGNQRAAIDVLVYRRIE